MLNISESDRFRKATCLHWIVSLVCCSPLHRMRPMFDENEEEMSDAEMLQYAAFLADLNEKEFWEYGLVDHFLANVQRYTDKRWAFAQSFRCELQHLMGVYFLLTTSKSTRPPTAISAIFSGKPFRYFAQISRWKSELVFHSSETLYRYYSKRIHD